MLPFVQFSLIFFFYDFNIIFLMYIFFLSTECSAFFYIRRDIRHRNKRRKRRKKEITLYILCVCEIKRKNPKGNFPNRSSLYMEKEKCMHTYRVQQYKSNKMKFFKIISLDFLLHMYRWLRMFIVL